MRRQQGVWDGAVRACFADYYGATLPLKWAKSIQAAPAVLGGFTLGMLVGVLVFFLALVMCTFCLLLHANVVFGIMLVAAVLCLLPVISTFVGRKDRPMWQLPVGVCGLSALFWGDLLGRYCFASYGYFALMYANSRTYYNVDAAQRAGAVGDAGRLVFAAEAHVDAGRAVGYIDSDGSTYCVAPILGLGEPRRVEFWAVGMDCCALRGGFHCGAADDPDARGAAVLFRPPSMGPLGALLHSDHGQKLDKYDVARKKAQATLGIYGGNSEEAVLVSWLTDEDLAMMSRRYVQKAWAFIAASSFVYTLVSAPIAWLSSRSAAGELPRSRDDW